MQTCMGTLCTKLAVTCFGALALLCLCLGRSQHGLAMDALFSVMLWEHKRNYGLGMDAPVSVMLLEILGT